MPWKECHKMDERTKFIGRLLEGEKMIDVCRAFGISRKTGYKFRERYLKQGLEGISDLSRAPKRHPNQTSKEIEELIVSLRKEKGTWGPKKLKARLERLYPGLIMPAHSTIGEIIRRYGLPVHKRRRRRKGYYPTSLRESKGPNDIWCVDFKGQFRLGNKRYCYPLTVTDHYSRYLIGCESLENTKIYPTLEVFEELFQRYGIPKVIRSDNGTPFASCGLNGWTKLSVWWLRLGIELEHIEPGHPEQNGRHERMHLTLKREAIRPAKQNFLQQQERFDLYREEYNNERPHEALEMKTPDSLYVKSKKRYPEKLGSLEYPVHDIISRVQPSGIVRLRKNHSFYLSQALSGENVGFREIEPQQWLVTFMNMDVGYYNENDRRFLQHYDS